MLCPRALPEKNHILQPNGFLMIFLMSCGSGFGLYTIVQCSVNDAVGREWPTSRLQCRQCSAVQWRQGHNDILCSNIVCHRAVIRVRPSAK